MIDILQTVVTVVLFFGILGTLVVIHELGHFVVARLAGVRVLEFGIGFPPRAKVLRSKGETLYTLNWLPIGGFVKLEGEDGDQRGDPRSFSAKSLPTRLLILVSGVVMNVLLAFVIFTGLALHGDPLIGVRITEVQVDSPAAAAGVEPGDVIVSLNGKVYNALGRDFLLDDTKSRAGETVTLGIERPDGSTGSVVVTLRSQADVDAGKGAIGVTTAVTTARAVASYEPLEAVVTGAQRTVGALGLILGGLGELVGSVARDPTAPPPVAGPIGIADQIGSIFWQLGPVLTLYVAGILSANLAVVNILPFPPLDGGRMLMITLKRVFGSRISLRAEQLTYLVGFVFLFAFIIWVSGFDIIRSLGGGPPPSP